MRAMDWRQTTLYFVTSPYVLRGCIYLLVSCNDDHSQAHTKKMLDSCNVRERFNDGITRGIQWYPAYGVQRRM